MPAPVQLPTSVVALTTDGFNGSSSVQQTVKIGDTVHIVGKVASVIAEQFSVIVNTHGNGPQLVTVDDTEIIAVEIPDPPAEPDNGTWVVALHDSRHDGLNAFVRDDADAPADPDRRYRRRWRDVGSGAFVDWPTVITRGGDPANQLIPAGGLASARDIAISDAVVDVLKQHRHGVDIGTITRKVGQAVPGATGGQALQALQALRRMETAHVVAHLPDPQPEGLWVYLSVYLSDDPVQPTPGQQPLPTT